MIAEAILDYMIEGIEESFGLGKINLVEKTLGLKKVKLKFQDTNIKCNLEFEGKGIAKIIYNHFLDTYDRDSITVGEFSERFSDKVDSGLVKIDKKADVERLVNKIVTEIKSEKLPFSKRA